MMDRKTFEKLIDAFLKNYGISRENREALTIICEKMYDEGYRDGFHIGSDDYKKCFKVGIDKGYADGWLDGYGQGKDRMKREVEETIEKNSK